MAENTTTIDAPPERVFAVIADPRTYPDWVVGADVIRAVDSDWPAVGSRFHHTVGVGPAKVDDSTRLVDIEPPRRLVLEASMGGAGAAQVEFVVTPSAGGGTDVTIEEHPVEGIAERLPTALTDAGLKLRNAETLRRLRNFVESL